MATNSPRIAKCSTASGSESPQLLERVREGDERAATELFDRYVDRLIELAASRLSPKLARRLDPEDVVQSACRSFYRLARADRCELGQDEDGELWHLLAAITVNKARKAVKRHKARKRSVEAERSAARDMVLLVVPPEALAREPSPAEAAVLAEQTQRTMSRLSPLQRQILLLRLQGHSNEETARRAECSQRTVRRALELTRLDLEKRLWEGDPN